MIWKKDGVGSFDVGDGLFTDVADTPGSIDALADGVRTRVGEGMAIYPVGVGSSLGYGGIPARPGAVVGTLALDRVVDYPAADMTITVEAGIRLAHLQEILSVEGQRLTLDPPHPDCATLGGIFATNSSGPRRFGSGRPRDLILGMSFVDGSGKILKGGGRVVKNVAGYDLPKLLTGSLGTLGIIAELTLKVRPKPEASAIAWLTGSSIESMATALDRLNTSKTRPMAIELLNSKAAGWVVGSLDLPSDSWTLAVGFEDNEASVAWQLGAIRDELGDLLEASTLSGEAAGPLWTTLANLPNGITSPFAILASLPPSAVPAMAASFDTGLWAVQAHAGNGILRAIRIGEIDEAEAVATTTRVRLEAAKVGGNVILERCPTAWKSRLKVWGEPRSDWALMAKVKRALDPGGVMNPGRFVGTM